MFTYVVSIKLLHLHLNSIEGINMTFSLLFLLFFIMSICIS